MAVNSDGPPPGGTRHRGRMRNELWSEMSSAENNLVFLKMLINTNSCNKFVSFTDMKAYLVINAIKKELPDLFSLEGFGKGEILLKVASDSRSYEKSVSMTAIVYQKESIPVMPT